MDPHSLNLDPDTDADPSFQVNLAPEFWWPKTYPKDKDVKATGEAFSHQKRTSSTSKSGYRIQIRIRIQNTDFTKVLLKTVCLMRKFSSSRKNRNIFPLLRRKLWRHRLNMELDLQSLFGLDVTWCSHWLRPRNPSPPLAFGLTYEGRYWSAKIDDISL